DAPLGPEQARRRSDDLKGLTAVFRQAGPILKARLLWVLGPEMAMRALLDDDPRIREQAVRMLGRDDSRNGHVEYRVQEAQAPPAALKYLCALLPMPN